MTDPRHDPTATPSDGFLHRNQADMNVHHNLNRAGITMPALRAARPHRSRGRCS